MFNGQIGPRNLSPWSCPPGQDQGTCPPGTKYQILPKSLGSAPGYDLKANIGLEEGIILFLCLFEINCGNNNLIPLQSSRHYTTHMMENMEI